MRGVAADRIDPIKVFERDRWRCQLCGCSTPERLRGQMVDHAPELDHIVPLARGGAHTWSNVQCACRRCNGEKADTPRGQLRCL
jgi:5-methylcytosine-specific restriction endonuclease McrA